MKQTRYGAGKGLFAGEALKRGDFIIEYVGKKIPNSIADDLGTRYLFDLENGFTIDGSPMSNTARWINHACEPNVEAELDEEEEKIRILAMHDIEPGEELTIDYGDEYVKDFITPHGCKCKKCTAEREASAVPTVG